MDCSAVLRSFNCSVGTIVLKESRSGVSSLTTSGRLSYSQRKQKGLIVSCLKTSEPEKIDGSNDSAPQRSGDKSRLSAALLNGFEALLQEVCDETEIAELKLKVGGLEMHMKRNIGATESPLSNISPMSAPHIPSEPMVDSSPSPPQPSPPKASPKSSPFANTSLVKSSKLAALEASGSTAYELIPSPAVGTFRRGRMLKGKRLPPSCKEGELIKEGQVIGYVDRFGSDLPVKSKVDGEVLKILFNDGDAIGYGEPLVAVLPSFHGIK